MRRLLRSPSFKTRSLLLLISTVAASGSCARAVNIEKKAISIVHNEVLGKLLRQHKAAPASAAGAGAPATAAKNDDAVAAALAAASELPASFNALGLFTGPNFTQPLGSLIPFSVKVTLWSDGLGKQRYIYLPPNTTLTIDSSTNKFIFPNGSIFIKHFSDGDHPVETRVLVRSADASWKMASYQWTGAGDATRVDAPTLTTAAAPSNKAYRLPSPAECQLCHVPGSSPVILGFEPDQLNSAATGASTTPLQDLAAISGATTRLFGAGVIDAIKAAPSRPDPNDANLSATTRAHAYLDLNCSTCHNPKGVANFLDFSLATGLTTDYPPAFLTFQRVVPGDLANSVIWQKYTDPTYRMPPVSLYQDPLGLQLLHDWLSSWPVTATAVTTTSKGGGINASGSGGNGAGSGGLSSGTGNASGS